MSRFIKLCLMAMSTFLIMIQFQNCSKAQMTSIDLAAQNKFGGGAATAGGGNDQLGIPAENQPAELVNCPATLVNGNVEYIPIQVIEQLVVNQPADSRNDYLDDLLNSCKSVREENSESSSSDPGSSSDSEAQKCVKVCHPEGGSTQNNTDDDSSDDSSSDDDSSDDNSSDDDSSDD